MSSTTSPVSRPPSNRLSRLRGRREVARRDNSIIQWILTEMEGGGGGGGDLENPVVKKAVGKNEG